MNNRDIAAARLVNQQIESTKFKTSNEMVGWMGAMQAQDFYMAKWALGLRLPGSTDKTIQQSIDRNEIIRTHVLRPTWHFVSPEDICWMLELSSPQIKSSMKSNNKILGLTDSIFAKSNGLIERALSGNKHLTREELMAVLKKAKINTDSYRSAHLMMHAELDKIVCSGIINNKKQTYTLLNERVKSPKALHREEALATLAQRYFTSHCPATLQDFTWWSGLPAGDARHALESVKKNFISETIHSKIFWLTNSFSVPVKMKDSIQLLPAFDEFLISYKDRSASLAVEHQEKSMTVNGIFKPILVVNGEVKGIWKRTISKDRVIVETNFFKSPSKILKKNIEKAAEKFGKFLGMKVEVTHKDISNQS